MPEPFGSAPVSPGPTGCGRRPWGSRLVGCLFAGAHPGGDPRGETEHECGDAMLGVVVTAAGLVPGEEGGQLVGGLDEVERGDDDQREAEYGEQHGDGDWRVAGR